MRSALFHSHGFDGVAAIASICVDHPCSSGVSFHRIWQRCGAAEHWSRLQCMALSQLHAGLKSFWLCAKPRTAGADGVGCGIHAVVFSTTSALL